MFARVKSGRKNTSEGGGHVTHQKTEDNATTPVE